MDIQSWTQKSTDGTVGVMAEKDGWVGEILEGKLKEKREGWEFGKKANSIEGSDISIEKVGKTDSV